MADLPSIDILDPDLDAIASAPGHVCVFIQENGNLDKMARRVNRLSKGALARFAESETFGKMKDGEAKTLGYPGGMAAEAVHVIKLEKRTRGSVARDAGATLGAVLGKDGALVLAVPGLKGLEDVLLGALLRAYSFDQHKTGEAKPGPGALQVMTSDAEIGARLETIRALASGVHFTRDLVNEPSNVLTTTEFAARLEGLRDLGVNVEVIEEPELEKLGMRTLLAVGQGSESPSKVVVMEWAGGGAEAPVALVGKGVVFDTGGISIKPAAGMEDMTMDMGGAGTQKQYETLATRLSGEASTLSVSEEGLWLRQGGADGQTVIRAERANLDGTTLYGVTFLGFSSDGTPTFRIDAKEAKLVEGAWAIKDAKEWRFDTDSIIPEVDSFETPALSLASNLTRNQILDSFGTPSSIPIWELPGFIDRLEAAGFSARVHRTFFHMELALPILLAAMVLVGAGFTMRHTRFGRTGIMVLAALGLGFTLYFIRNFAAILGENGQIPVILAAWGPPVAALLLPLGLLLHLEDG